MRLALAFVVIAAVTAVTLAGGGGSTPPEPSAEEQTLRAAGLTTDGPMLLEFFRARAQAKTDGDKMLALARKLGDPAPEVRAKTAAQLVCCGPSAVPALRHIVNDLDDTVASDNAQRCLQWLEGPRRTELPVAAAKMLAVRKPDGACEALVTYLPFADDHTVVDGVKAALVRLVAAMPKTDPSLVLALKDPVPLRRAVAVEVLCSAGQNEVLPDVRKLLDDPKAQVRLRAALALVERQDEKAIGILIDLLVDLAPAQRKLVEDALQALAGEWSPNPGLAGDDEVSRKIRRDAWAGWWKNTDGPTLLAAFKKRTLTAEDTKLVMELIKNLGDPAFNVRERASADLIAMGPKINAYLKQASKDPDVERSQRAETCLKQIHLNEDKHKLPTAAPRLLALRNPPGATEALLAYLPYGEEEAMQLELSKALKHIAMREGKAPPALVKALEDPLTLRRAIAGEALAGSKVADALPAVRKMLQDPEPSVRLRIGMALVYAADKESVPALIDMVGDMPRAQAWPAEELLYRLAGDKAPQTATGDDAVARKKFKADWQAWWKEHGEKVDLAALEQSPAVLGFTLVCEVNDNGNNGRVLELDKQGKVRWTVEGFNFPTDVWYLPGNRVLVCECGGNRVTERDLKGAITWQFNPPGQPVNVQRLPNGNTFIAVFNGPVMEVDKNSKQIYQFHINGGVQAAYKTTKGDIWVLTQQSTCVKVDTTGKELKRFNLMRMPNWTSAIDITPKGHILVAQGDNQITEYDPEGKVVKQLNSNQNTSATRLSSGHTLVSSYQNQTVVELNGTGTVVWTYKTNVPYRPFRARQR
jgi:HEAT repeat protein